MLIIREGYKNQGDWASKTKKNRLNIDISHDPTASYLMSLTPSDLPYNETASGLKYRVLTEGDGNRPQAGSTVTVHYTGTFQNGEVFDSSVTRGQPATFPLQNVIAGWTEGLQLMASGSKYQFIIPPELGYGDKGAGDVIPPFETLHFEVDLIAIA